ncbi:MAG: lipopolysaccharide heptosyltransferase family protein [Proteobacteria bacterium]|nr:lipopolysaccharide heptosyltransferase family protein [Pseudomonadota bacterium]
MKLPQKILVVRMDRLGDLLMSLPSLVYLRKSFPNSEIDLSCQKSFHELLRGFCDENRVGLVDSCQKHYDAALFLQGTFRDCFELFKWRVATRSGLFSKPWSFVLLNQGVRQRRSQTAKNEAEFNLDLAKALTSVWRVSSSEPTQPGCLPKDPKSYDEALKRLKDLGIDKSFVVFHPGMRGSALNVSAEVYLQLMTTYEASGLKILLSVGPEKKDQEMKEKLMRWKSDLSVISGLSLIQLSEVFRLAETVVAPSTGPLHLAHWVGTKTVGLYSPVRAHHPIRWAPWGGIKKGKVLVPEVKCPAQRECLGASCELFPCMERADWKSLLLSAENG